MYVCVHVCVCVYGNRNRSVCSGFDGGSVDFIDARNEDIHGYIHTYIHIYIYVCTHVHELVYFIDARNENIHTCIHTCLHTRTGAC